MKVNITPDNSGDSGEENEEEEETVDSGVIPEIPMLGAEQFSNLGAALAFAFSVSALFF